MKMEENVISGIFIKELNRRFICDVIIDGKLEECFIPSSVKLKNYLKLTGKTVLLTENKSLNKRTRYSLYAVKYYNKFIFLNLNIANKLVEENLLDTGYCESQFLNREKLIDGYKTDFVISGKNTEVIEVKSVLNIRRKVTFPNVYSKRMIDQLKKILLLLEKNIKVSYYIVALSPIIKEILINSEYMEFYNLFIDCINHGMIIKGFSIINLNNEFQIYPNLSVKY